MFEQNRTNQQFGNAKSINVLPGTSIKFEMNKLEQSFQSIHPKEQLIYREDYAQGQIYT